MNMVVVIIAGPPGVGKTTLKSRLSPFYTFSEWKNNENELMEILKEESKQGMVFLDTHPSIEWESGFQLYIPKFTISPIWTVLLVLPYNEWIRRIKKDNKKKRQVLPPYLYEALIAAYIAHFRCISEKFIIQENSSTEVVLKAIDRLKND